MKFLKLILLLLSTTSFYSSFSQCFDSEEKFKIYLSNKKVNLDSLEGIYEVNISIEIYEKNGMILATPRPTEKRYIIKSNDGYELCKLDKEVHNRFLISKTEKPNNFKIRKINLDNVGIKDVFCNAAFKNNLLSFVYKVTYEEANKMPQSSLSPGQWMLLRYKCKKIR